MRREYSVSILLGVVTLASVLPLLLLGIYGLSYYVATERSNQLGRLTRYTATLANAVDRELRGYMDTAQVLSASPSISQGNLEDFGVLARNVSNRANVHIILIDPSGQQLVNTRLPTDVGLPRTADMGSLRQVLESGKPAVGNLFVDAVSDQPHFAVQVPVTVDGEIRYILSLVPGPGAIRTVVEQTYLPAGALASIVDGNGRIVARSFRHDDLHGKPATYEFFAQLVEPRGITESVDLDGREVVTSHEQSRVNRWRTLVWTPKSVLDRPLQESMYLALGLAALTLLASLAGGFLSGRVIAGPVRRLLKAAQDLKAGQIVRFESTRQREANIVGSTLAEAATSIAAREKALRMSELHTRYIMRELAHRSKNLLAVVQAIARQTGRAARDVKEFNLQLGERLAALGRSQDLLVQRKWQGVALEDLAAAQLKPFIAEGGQRITMQGPPVLLSSDAAQNIGMALHELATNASKHGAFSVPSGRVEISWEWLPAADGERRLELCWRETGGPEVKPPAHKGFGHTVIEQLAAASLRGTAKLDWQPHGLVWTLEIPECALAGRREEMGDEFAAGSTDLLNTGPGGTDNLGRS